MNMQVQPAIVDTALPIPRPLDIERLQALVMKLLGGWELTGHLVKAAKEDPQANHEDLLNHVELIADTFADMTCEVFDMLLQAEREDEDADE
jgi:hypothetical protein